MPTPPSITLRPFGEPDAGFFAGLAADERVTRFVGSGRSWTAETIRDRVRAALRSDPPGTVGALRWFVAEESGGPVGVVVSARRDRGVEIGYWVAPDHWGRGIAGAMIDQALAAVPAAHGPARILARVAPGNAGSARALTRRGFQHEGTHDGLDHYVLEQDRQPAAPPPDHRAAKWPPTAKRGKLDS